MLAIFCGIMLALMLRYPGVVLQSALGGLEAFARGVLPTLFPYMVLCQLAGDGLSRCDHIPASLPCAALGLLGGSPAGARLSASLYMRGRLSWRALHLMCAVCGTVSPMFITGTVGAWIQQPRFALCVLLCHWLGAVLCGLFTLFLPIRATGLHHSQEDPAHISPPLRLPDAVTQSALAMLTIGGCITLFSVLAAMPGAIFPSIDASLRAVLHAILEMAGGCHALIARDWEPRTTCCAISACVSFGGVSILMQNLAFLRPAGFRTPTLISIRCLHALFAAALCYVFYPLLCV